MKENSGLAIAVGVIFVVFLVALPAAIVTLVYLFVSVYAIAKAAGAGGPGPNPATILIGVVGIVAGLVTLLYCGISLLGRSMDPKRRADH